MTGMPSGRCRPPALDTHARLTGQGSHPALWCCAQSARSALDLGPSAVMPSIPAVMRPALTSATRRTAIRALARERSISFCKLRTFFRSPARDAVKIRCRRRRTSPSTRCQSIDSHARASPSGPFAPAAAGASNLSFGSRVAVTAPLHRLT